MYEETGHLVEFSNIVQIKAKSSISVRGIICCFILTLVATLLFVSFAILGESDKPNLDILPEETLLAQPIESHSSPTTIIQN